jgi:hypothetical protein
MEAQVLQSYEILDRFRDNSILISRKSSKNLAPGCLITMDGKSFVVNGMSTGPHRVLITLGVPKEGECTQKEFLSVDP